MRLSQALMMWLSKDSCFWGRVEDGSLTLSLFGLQQVKILVFLFNVCKCPSENWGFVVSSTSHSSDSLGWKCANHPSVGQFVFDLQFFIQIAAIGNYSSRKMRQTVSAMIARAKRAANLNLDEGRYILV
jgi:hypothetical protein